MTNLPPDAHARVRDWINYFARRDAERFARFVQRGNTYRDVVQDILRETGLPKEFYYLGMIESGYSNHAHSHASAVGAWQFIRGTAKRYGLHVGRYVDERRDPIRATEAAAKYLKDLHRRFGSWPLAMAAYNSGEGKVERAIRRAGTKDYWTLVRKRLLPPETRAYVPKFIAAATIGENLRHFGFRIPDEDKYPDVEAVEVPSPVRVDAIAEVTGISEDELLSVNPHLRAGITPPGQKTYEIWIPEGKVSEVERQAPRLVAYRIRGLASDTASGGPARRNYHVIRRGETLSMIADRYNVSVAYLKYVNGLRSDQVPAGRSIRINARAYRHGDNIKLFTYKVKKGDNLNDIARRFRCSVAWIKQANRLKQNTIYAGQPLKVRATL